MPSWNSSTVFGIQIGPDFAIGLGAQFCTHTAELSQKPGSRCLCNHMNWNRRPEPLRMETDVIPSIVTEPSQRRPTGAPGNMFQSLIGDNLAAIGFPAMPGFWVQTLFCWQTGPAMTLVEFRLPPPPSLPLQSPYVRFPAGLRGLKGSNVRWKYQSKSWRLQSSADLRPYRTFSSIGIHQREVGRKKKLGKSMNCRFLIFWFLLTTLCF